MGFHVPLTPFVSEGFEFPFRPTMDVARTDGGLKPWLGALIADILVRSVARSSKRPPSNHPMRGPGRGTSISHLQGSLTGGRSSSLVMKNGPGRAVGG
jgi:hypothetical protein